MWVHIIIILLSFFFLQKPFASNGVIIDPCFVQVTFLKLASFAVYPFSLFQFQFHFHFHKYNSINLYVLSNSVHGLWALM